MEKTGRIGGFRYFLKQKLIVNKMQEPACNNAVIPKPA